MEVKTGVLKNNLSRYLKQVQRTGESITVLDRNRPVARLAPWRGKRNAADSAWAKERETLLAKAARLGIKLRVPEKRPVLFRDIPIPSPTGNSGVNAVVEMRREKDY